MLFYCFCLQNLLDPTSNHQDRSSKLEEDKSRRAMEYLPHEIVLDIFSRLPVTSFLQCKLVCRSWRNLTEDRLLLNKHPGLFLHCDYPIRNQLYSVHISVHHKGVQKLQVPEMLPEFDVVGSCNGLLCLRDSSDSSSIFVYNPFTGKCRELPTPRKYEKETVVLGFGFQSISKQYKVVRTVYYRDNPMRRYHFRHPLPAPKSEVQIFTQGSTTWRSIGNITHLIYEQSQQILVKEKLHWITRLRRHGTGRLIVSFDLEDEKFREVPGPECGALKRLNYDLVALGNCLSGAIHGNFGQFEIWVMKKYGVRESWIKEYSIGIYVPKGLQQKPDLSFKVSKFYRKSSFVRVLGLLKNGEILLESKCRALVSYDPKLSTFKHHEFPGMPFLFQTVLHVGCP